MSWLGALLIGFCLLRLAKKFFATPESIGKQGEKAIEKKLRRIPGCEGRTLRNLYLPKRDGQTTEIDLVFITVKGIFVIESKNYSGWIFGTDTHPQWTSTLRARRGVEKHRFPNPVWQNRTHMRFLQRYLGEDVRLWSVIVFSNRCELMDISLSASDVAICHLGGLGGMIQRIWRGAPDILTEQDIERIFMRLEPLTNQGAAVKQTHIDNVRRRFDSVEVCPRCGGRLVLRTARKGPRAGSRFYGCSNYPRCKYTRNID